MFQDKFKIKNFVRIILTDEKWKDVSVTLLTHQKMWKFFYDWKYWKVLFVVSCFYTMSNVKVRKNGELFLLVLLTGKETERIEFEKKPKTFIFEKITNI